MVREARLDDIVRLLPLVEEYSNEIGLNDYYDKKTTAHTLRLCVFEGLCLCDENYNGIIAGSTTHSPWNSYVRVLHEHIYFVKPNARNGTLGKLLLQEYDRRSKDWELNSLKLMHNSPDIRERYKRLGYREAETTYMRFNGG